MTTPRYGYGDDWAALGRAKERLVCALHSFPRLSPFEVERTWELLKAGSLIEYEASRAAWAELARAIAAPLQPKE